ncbi:DUF4012 domain-containing protein [Nocardioides sp. P5_E3]
MPSTRRVAPRRLIRPATVIGGLLLLLVVLALLAIPFLSAPGHAEDARAELTAAKDALDAGDTDAAVAAVERARSETDDLQGSVQGIGGDVWSRMPVAGGPVRDVRRLGNALDQLVAVAETGVRILPQVRGEESTLVDDGNVDIDVLEDVIDDLREVSTRLADAQAELADVADSRVIVGDRLAEARDQAQGEVDPLAEGLETIDPLLEHLPKILGRDASRQYLVALLNPAEMLFSGGTPQNFVIADLDAGRLTVGPTLDGTAAPGVAVPRYWKKVKGNPLHRGQMKPALATMAPDWRVSGNELANAWRSLRGRRLAGVVVIDVVALSRMLELTGPLELPTLGTLTGDNLVEKLIGSYDTYPDVNSRRAVNRAIGPVFVERLLSGNDPVGTGRSLADAADERRFAMFFRSPDEQAVFDALGLTGRLSDTEHDYIGVFTQNKVPSKSDYWQRRTVSTDVAVREDGSARVKMEVEVHNDSPPYLQPGPDPRLGYFTRWNTLSIAPFLPKGAASISARMDGEPVEISPRNFYGRYFIRPEIEFAPQARHTLAVTYDVPAAAVRDGDGDGLAYRLALDPQGMVDPQDVRVRVSFPRGYAVDASPSGTGLPDGWSTRGGRVATYTTDALEVVESFEIVARP